MLKVREEILDFSPYLPGLSIDEIKSKYNLKSVIKLASNENPLGISPRVKEVIKRYSDYCFRYPRSGNPELVKKISKRIDIDDKYIVVTNGSDEIIDLIIRTIATPYRDNIVLFNPSFSIYTMQAKFHGIDVKYVCLNEDFSFNFDGIYKTIDDNTRLIFLTNPDNPSGFCENRSNIIDFLHNIPSHITVIIDEAYVEFCDDPEKVTCIREVLKYENLGVIRTFSKLFGLAGLRIGYGILPLWLSDYIRRVKLPFSVNIVAERAAIEVLDDEDYISHTRDVVIKGREYLKKELEKLGCRVYPSQGNFLMFSPGLDADMVFYKLLEQGIIIRPLKSYGLDKFLRVSIGREDENTRFIEAIKKVL